MIALLSFLLAVLASPCRSKSSLLAENAMLRHQVVVLRRKVKGRIPLTNGDRWFFMQLYRWFPSILGSARSNTRQKHRDKVSFPPPGLRHLKSCAL
jgi:hypothetical protein